jgi:hypothetical protein
MHGFAFVFAKWLESTWWGTFVRTTTWGYPYVQVIHFTGLSLWLATNVVLDLRLLGAGNKRKKPAELRDALFSWNWIAFAVVLLGGFLLFSATASGYIQNPAFQVKLGILVPLALIWHIFVQQKTRTWGQTMDAPPVAKAAGFVELLLWLGVVIAAVQIPNH